MTTLPDPLDASAGNDSQPASADLRTVEAFLSDLSALSAESVDASLLHHALTSVRTALSATAEKPF